MAREGDHTHDSPTENATGSGIHERIRDYWDLDAETYDRAPGHAVAHPGIAAAWRAALARHLPAPGASVLDVGAGTGAISLLLAELGYRVTALDLSPGMLAVARRKAGERGLDVAFVDGPAHEPPPGPFDAVVERHVLWTLPDPVRALTAWREASPSGRLVLYEGLWSSGRRPFDRLRSRAARAARRVFGTPSPEHHSEYDPEVLAALPFADGLTLDAVLGAAASGGWRRARVERLRDVEWAERLAGHPVVGLLEVRPRFAVLLDA